jgi:hypothetical protein
MKRIGIRFLTIFLLVWAFELSVFFYHWENYGWDNACTLFWVWPGDITVEPKPHDCDYQTAPLGKKWCHYTGIVLTQDRVTTDPYGGDAHQKHEHIYTVVWKRQND